jgi:hypothetical protein
MMGWEGTEITSQIRTLIEDHHLGAVLLTTKNLKSTTCVSFVVRFENSFSAFDAAEGGLRIKVNSFSPAKGFRLPSPSSAPPASSNCVLVTCSSAPLHCTPRICDQD